MRLSPHAFEEPKARAVAWLTAWDSQGIHRTGTTGDEAGALWLTQEAAGFGIKVASEAFALPLAWATATRPFWRRSCRPVLYTLGNTIDCAVTPLIALW